MITISQLILMLDVTGTARLFAGTAWKINFGVVPITSASGATKRHVILRPERGKLSTIFHKQPIKMEICIDSMESAQNAVKGGAMRLEVCAALSDGGLTPTPGFVNALRKVIAIPLFAMIRVRGGNFVYCQEEVDAMLLDLKLLKGYGVNGFVFGALTADNEIDLETSKKIVDAAAPLPVTFHRAFDEVNSSPQLAVSLIAKIGFKRILTSGRENSAEKGLQLIKSLASTATDGILIMPGAGITVDNIKKIKDESMCKEFHASARQSKTQSGTKLKMGTEKDSQSFMVTHEETVRRMVAVVNAA